MTGKLIIVCGIDGSGKTTLIEGLKRRIVPDFIFNFSYPKEAEMFQCGAFAKGEYFGSIKIFKELLARDKTIICDRFHLGEYAYGLVMRQYPEWFAQKIVVDTEKAMEDSGINFNKIVLIILHSSPETILRRKGKTMGKEYVQNCQDLFEIDKRYSLVSLKGITKLVALHIHTDSELYNNHPELVLETVIQFIDGM
jgi:thymidylate kinase